MPRRAPDNGQQLVILADGDGPTTHRAMGAIEARGGQVIQRYGDRVLICAAPPRAAEAIDALKSVRAIYGTPVERAPRSVTPAEELGIAAWNLRRSKDFAEAKAERPREGVAWDQPGATPDAPDGPGMTHVMEGVPAQPHGFIGTDLSPYLIGSVAVGLVIVDGPTPDLVFSDTEKTKVVAEVQEGLGWLAQREPRASVSFAYDIRSVQIANPPDPNKSGYELLEAHWRDPALISLGYTGNVFGAKQHAEKIRRDLATRWAYVAFFTKYPVAHFAYALKPKLVMHYDNDGWGPDNIDRVFTHETGHIFGCPDEYASSNCSCTAKFGWWREPNANCQTCATPQVPCLMSANTWEMCSQTPIHLGWRDSNNDGILDDTSDAGLFDYRKFCSAVPLVCQLIGFSPEPVPPAPPGVAAGVAGDVPGRSGGGGNWPGGGVPMLLLERTLGHEELARVEAAVRAEELAYLMQVEKRLRAALRQVRDYRATLESDESP
jgi:hypothetical protein